MKILRVNMTDLSTTYENLPKEWEITGGRALTAKIMNAEVPPESDPLGGHNKLIFATGPLAGTMAPSCGRISVGTKSPITLGIKEANAGGPAAQKLGKLGIRALIVEGKPKNNGLYLLHISKNGALIEDADAYRGLRNYALVEKLHEKFPKKSTVVSIGVVGERKRKAAAVDMTDKDGRTSRHAARGGVGAVMGAKGLKAIVIDDTGARPLEPANKEAFRQTVRDWVKFLPTDASIKMFSTFGSAVGVVPLRGLGSMPAFNFGSAPIDAEPISGQKMDELQKERGGSMDACMPGCVVKCSLVYHAPDKTHLTSSFEYEATAMVGTNLGITDPDIVARYDRICDEIGIDVIECGAALGVAADAGKIKMGDPDGVFGLLKEIENGTDFGNILADGVVSTCKALGVNRIPAVKGQAIPAHDPRVGKATGVTYLTSPMGADHTAGLSYSGDFMANEGAVEASLAEQIFCASRDAMGYCRFASPDDKVKTIDFLTGLTNACYDLNLKPEDLIDIGRETLKDEIRFNKTSGFHTDNEPDPEFIRTEPVAPTEQVFGVKVADMEKIWDKLDDINVL